MSRYIDIDTLDLTTVKVDKKLNPFQPQTLIISGAGLQHLPKLGEITTPGGYTIRLHGCKPQYLPVPTFPPSAKACSIKIIPVKGERRTFEAEGYQAPEKDIPSIQLSGALIDVDSLWSDEPKFKMLEMDNEKVTVKGTGLHHIKAGVIYKIYQMTIKFTLTYLMEISQDGTELRAPIGSVIYESYECLDREYQKKCVDIT